MLWQDIIIAIAQIIFSYALIFQVYYGFKNKKSSVTVKTSALTFFGIYMLLFAFISLGLYFSTLSSLISAFCWYLLLIQGILYR
jgi:hypothetical protein